MYVINLNDLQGVELITSALRNTGCIASQELADGIDKYLLRVTNTGRFILANEMPALQQVKPKLQVVKPCTK